jgi:hypothetical protein
MWSGFSSRQLPVPAAEHVAEVLEHEPVAGAQPSVPRARTSQVVATRDHGRGDPLRPQGGAESLPGRQEIRHPLPDVRAVRQQSAQHAGALRRRWHR